MRRRLIAVLVGVVVLVLAVQDLPLVSHLRVVERDRLVTRLERDAFILAGRVEEHLRLRPGVIVQQDVRGGAIYLVRSHK